MRILYCEDEVDSGQWVIATLQKARHHVDYVSTADQAITLFDVSLQNNEPYDLIITDIGMPGHSGLYFASHARARGFTGRLAVLTAFERENVLGSLQHVNAEYWKKPQFPPELTELVAGTTAPEPEGDALSTTTPN